MTKPVTVSVQEQRSIERALRKQPDRRPFRERFPDIYAVAADHRRVEEWINEVDDASEHVSG